MGKVVLNPEQMKAAADELYSKLEYANEKGKDIPLRKFAVWCAQETGVSTQQKKTYIKMAQDYLDGKVDKIELAKFHFEHNSGAAGTAMVAIKFNVSGAWECLACYQTTTESAYQAARNTFESILISKMGPKQMEKFMREGKIIKKTDFITKAITKIDELMNEMIEVPASETEGDNDDDWMKSLPGYADEGAIHEQLARDFERKFAAGEVDKFGQPIKKAGDTPEEIKIKNGRAMENLIINDELDSLQEKVRLIEKSYNPKSDNLHFARLSRVDPALLEAMLSIGREAWSLIEREHAWEDRYWFYNLFQLISSGSLTIWTKNKQGLFSKGLISRLVTFLVDVSLMTSDPGNFGDITQRNFEALGNLLLAFQEDLKYRDLARQQAKMTGNEHMTDFVEKVITRVEEVEAGIASKEGI